MADKNFSAAAAAESNSLAAVFHAMFSIRDMDAMLTLSTLRTAAFIILPMVALAR